MNQRIKSQEEETQKQMEKLRKMTEKEEETKGLMRAKLDTFASFESELRGEIGQKQTELDEVREQLKHAEQVGTEIEKNETKQGLV